MAENCRTPTVYELFARTVRILSCLVWNHTNLKRILSSALIFGRITFFCCPCFLVPDYLVGARGVCTAAHLKRFAFKTSAVRDTVPCVSAGSIRCCAVPVPSPGLLSYLYALRATGTGLRPSVGSLRRRYLAAYPVLRSCRMASDTGSMFKTNMRCVPLQVRKKVGCGYAAAVQSGIQTIRKLSGSPQQRIFLDIREGQARRHRSDGF